MTKSPLRPPRVRRSRLLRRRKGKKSSQVSTPLSKGGCGLIGYRRIGRLHFANGPSQPWPRVAIRHADQEKRAGEWPPVKFNLGDQAASKVNLEGVAGVRGGGGLVCGSTVQIVDILHNTTQHHARLAIAALRAGKPLIARKRWDRSTTECWDLAEAASAAGRRLMVGACALR